VDSVTAILFVLGFVALIAGGELLVRGASGIARAFGIHPVVIGLTIVAFGTSSPEIAVAIGSAAAGKPDLIVGNVVGSNIYNVLLVLGLAAVITSLVVQRQLIRREVPLMILASGAVMVMAADGGIGRIDGLILLVALAAWLVYAVRQGRAEASTLEPVDRAASSPADLGRRVAFVLAGLALLVVGAQWLVGGAVAVAEAIGLSELVIGLTVVAIGTSLPEIATSVIASLRGQRDIAVGNVVGSNLFNLLAVLGLAALIAGEIPVAPGARTFDLPIMFAVSVACLPIFFTGYRIGRREGALFLAYGVGYTTYLLANATRHAEVTGLAEAIAAFVIPLTVATLVILASRQYQARRAGPG
jgi:cation:H+ antiporter